MVFRNRLDNVIKYLLITLMNVMVLNVLWQISTRFLLDSPSPFTDELSRFLLIWVGILGAAYASGKRLHVAIDLITSKIEDEVKARRLNVLIALLIISFAVTVLVIGGSRLVYITYTLKQNSAALQMPLSIVYSIIPLSGLLIVYYKLSDIWNR